MGGYFCQAAYQITFEFGFQHDITNSTLTFFTFRPAGQQSKPKETARTNLALHSHLPTQFLRDALRDGES